MLRILQCYNLMEFDGSFYELHYVVIEDVVNNIKRNAANALIKTDTNYDVIFTYAKNYNKKLSLCIACLLKLC